jgi:hypothetical protein
LSIEQQAKLTGILAKYRITDETMRGYSHIKKIRGGYAHGDASSVALESETVVREALTDVLGSTVEFESVIRALFTD